MRIQHETTRVFPVLLLELDPKSAAELGSALDLAGFEVVVSSSADSALQALRKAFFFALVVVADLNDPASLMTLAALRKRTPKSWMIVAAPDCDVQTCDLIHRYGGDACVALPISPEDLIDRLDAYQMRARPSL
jgi:DNA-binding response OmpR family regulator